VEELIILGQKADGIKVDEEVDIVAEIARRENRLDNLEKAKQELHSRAQEQYELDKSKYAEKMAEREAYIEKTGKKPRGRVPSPPFLP
jgi:F0F1-type ATP synthase epsilon subunit